MDMCHGPILSKTIRFAFPVLITTFLQQLFSAADVMLAGRLTDSGSNAVAAIGCTSALTGLLINFFIGCSVGSSVKVSHAIGSHDKERIHKSVHTAILLSVVIGAFLSAAGFFLSKPMLQYMSTPDYLIDLSDVYLKTYFLGMIPYMVYNFAAAILRAAGESQKPLYYLLISGPVKILLTFFFTKVIPLDVAGLALATNLSQTLAAALVIIELMKRKDDCKLTLSKLRFHKAELLQILRLGVPSGIQSATFSLSSVVIQAQINSFSLLNGFIAGDSAATSIVQFANVITGAYHHTAMAFVGQNVGAGNYERVRKIYRISLAATTVFVVISSMLICIFAKPLLSIYITDSPEAISWGAVKITYLFLPLFLQGIMDVASGTLRGMGVSISTMIISLAGVCGVRLLWVFTVFSMPQFHTPQTLYHSYWISWIITFASQHILFTIMYKRRTKCIR